MAEKYGTVPPKFTRAWWEYFWMYYKWHTIAAAFIILLIIITTYQNLTAPEYDLTVTYAGEVLFSEEMSQKIEEELSPLCKDVDENGENSVAFSPLHISLDATDAEYTMAMNTKLQLALAEDETYLFILDKENAMRYQGEDATDCVFAPLDNWLTAEVSKDSLFSAHGKGYGVAVSECKVFSDLGIDLKDHYVFMRYYPRKDQIKKQLAGYEAAVELANAILK